LLHCVKLVSKLVKRPTRFVNSIRVSFWSNRGMHLSSVSLTRGTREQGCLQPLQTPVACHLSLANSGQARQSQGNNPLPLDLGPPPPSRPQRSTAPLLGGSGQTQTYMANLAFASMGRQAVASKSGPGGARCGGGGAQGGAKQSSAGRGGSSTRPTVTGHGKEQSQAHGHNNSGGQPMPARG
jgi:hypothetical protein